MLQYNKAATLQEARIEGLSDDGRGIAQIKGKKVFIFGALLNEHIRFCYTRRHSNYDEGVTVEILTSMPDRVSPRCPHFGICGGCQLQHLQSSAQMLHKQDVLFRQLQHVVGVVPKVKFPALVDIPWGYRHKARLGCRYVKKKSRVLVGFRERNSSFVADLKHCEILHPSVGMRLESLQSLIGDLSIYQHIPQLEVAVGDEVTAIIIRHLKPFLDEDKRRLADFSDQTGIRFYLQASGKESIIPLLSEDRLLSYALTNHQIVIEFLPTDFTQVNPQINRELVDRVIEQFALSKEDFVLDFFCGVGNFSLPIARNAGAVAGYEGEAGLVARAENNARKNQLENCIFQVGDLADCNFVQKIQMQGANKVLLDPPRLGADNLLRGLDMTGIERLIYVSCNIATLVRDTKTLIEKQQFKLFAAGVVDMFPHTAHVESIFVFEK